MNFENTNIPFFGVFLYEPVTILTNIFTTLYCVYAFVKIGRFRTILATQWALFFLLIGISAVFGSLAHGVQHQLGDFFLRFAVFMVNALSLVAIYFCFNASSTYMRIHEHKQNKLLRYLVVLWISILLVVTFINNSFVLIKIHAGIVLLYALFVHIRNFSQPGSSLITAGILVSFFSILTHTLRFSISEWFNYKDISHVIMIISLVLISCGVLKKLRLSGGGYSETIAG